MKKHKIYLDVCTFNRPFDEQAQMKIRLETEAKLYIQASVRQIAEMPEFMAVFVVVHAVML
jgi:hypothetical protein